MRNIQRAVDQAAKITAKNYRLDMGLVEAKQLVDEYRTERDQAGEPKAIWNIIYRSYLFGLAVGSRN